MSFDMISSHLLAIFFTGTKLPWLMTAYGTLAEGRPSRFFASPSSSPSNVRASFDAEK